MPSFPKIKDDKVFWGRLAGFVSLAFLGPITYLIIRYNLFRPQTTMQIGLWGIIVFGLLIGLAGCLVWYYLEAMKTKYSMLKQCIHGTLKIILPLLLGLLICSWCRDNIDMMIETLWVFVGFEAAAIPVNPLPRWSYEQNIDGLGEIVKGVVSKVRSADTPKENSNKESK